MNTPHTDAAKEILKAIRYITISSASRTGEPWGTPVLAAFDDAYACYWTSLKTTQHSQNIQENPRVYLACFDSTQTSGESGGVYIQAFATELSDPAEITRAAALLYARKNKPPRNAEEFLGDSPKRMYRAIPHKAWVTLNADAKVDPGNAKREITLG